jgi:hypothetical protein
MRGPLRPVAEESPMKMTVRVAMLVLAFLVAGSQLALADEGQAASTSTRPPKNLKLVGDHWTPWDPPPAAEGAYVIQKGDTFWDLAGKWLGDPHLWPQVWDQNRYVLDSHWIYPGDPLSVPAKPNVVPPEGPPPSAETSAPDTGAVADTGAGADTGATTAVETPAPATRTTPAMIQVADERDLYCSGWIETDRQKALLSIVGADQPKIMQANNDIVYLNQGRSQGIVAGAEYVAVRDDHKVIHPATKETVGMYTQRMGHLRVLCAQENTATAIVLSACEDIRPGDELLPWKELQSPMLDHIPPVDRCTEPSGLAQGWIIDGGPDSLLSVGGGNLISTDLGPEDGIRPGSVLTLYKDNGDLPRILLGQAVVLSVEATSSTVKVLHANREVRRGDRAEVFQQ